MTRSPSPAWITSSTSTTTPSRATHEIVVRRAAGDTTIAVAALVDVNEIDLLVDYAGIAGAGTLVEAVFARPI
jgi:hypothetical protein